MSQSYTSHQGERNGVTGTWYEEQVRGVPGGYPYVKKHFVADTDRGAVDTRNAGATSKPWELYRHTTD